MLADIQLHSSFNVFVYFGGNLVEGLNGHNNWNKKKKLSSFVLLDTIVELYFTLQCVTLLSYLIHLCLFAGMCLCRLCIAHQPPHITLYA